MSSAESKPQLRLVTDAEPALAPSVEPSLADLAQPQIADSLNAMRESWARHVDLRPSEDAATETAREILGKILFDGLRQDAQAHESANATLAQLDKKPLTLTDGAAYEDRAFNLIAKRAEVYIDRERAAAGLPVAA